jgi:Flp pilus assembly protein TadG
VAVIELAFTLIILLLVMIGITEFGRAFWYYDALQKAVRDGARCLSIIDNLASAPTATTDPCLDLVVTEANSAGVSNAIGGPGAPLKNPDNVTFGFTTLAGSSPPKPEYVTVQIRNFEMGWIWSLGAPLPEPGGTAPMLAQSTMPYMR